jgi:hypothetical protein
MTAVLGKSCYPAGNVTLSAHTNKVLYQAGDVITTRITIDNEASRVLSTIEASLVRVTEYNDAKSKTYSFKKNI